MQENGYIGNDNALKFKNEKELGKAIDDYFLKCDSIFFMPVFSKFIVLVVAQRCLCN